MKFIAAIVFSSILSIACSEELLCTGEHEHVSQITPMCPQTCGTLLSHIRCLAPDILKPSCQCSEGYVRLDLISKKCVKHEECPKTEVKEELLCNGENEHLSQTTPCHVATCQNISQKDQLVCKSIIMKPSCLCNAGTVRDTTSGKCVAKCPQ